MKPKKEPIAVPILLTAITVLLALTLAAVSSCSGPGSILIPPVEIVPQDAAGPTMLPHKPLVSPEK